MSLYDYKVARELVKQDVPFYALIMAALMRADTDNARRLRAAWPAVCDETQARYDAPGALLPSDPQQSQKDARMRREGYDDGYAARPCKRLDAEYQRAWRRGRAALIRANMES